MSSPAVALETARVEGRVFTPPEDFSRSAHISSLDEYQRLYEHAKADPERFWAEVAGDLHWFAPWQKVLDWNPPWAKWFVGGRLNIAYNCLDRHVAGPRANKAAIIWEGEPGDTRTITYRQLLAEVSKLANVLTSLGVSKGDRVVIYMGMEPELPIAMLACARIGAPHTVIFGGFSANAIVDRIRDCEARLVITQDGTHRRGSEIKLKAVVDEALPSCPSVKDVIVYQRTGSSVEFIEGRDHWWHELTAEASDVHEAVPVDSDDPLFLLYTSGTTGKPKGVLHTAGGYSVGTYLTARWVFDLKDDDVFWCTADCGWITGHSYFVYGPLQNGATCVMFEGTPTYPQPDRFWKIVDRHKVSILYTAPTAIRTLMRFGDNWVDKHRLTSLRLLGSVGEPINPEAWLWYREHVGRNRCPIVDTWWQTETGMIMIAPLPGATSAKPGSATLPLPGVVADIVTAEGKPVPVGDKGFLVLKQPWPAMLRSIYKDPVRYVQQYWSQIPGTYFTGDGAHKDDDGYFWITGRVDDVMNVSGHRLSSAELESALEANPLVAEAAVVAKPDPLKGEVPFGFVILRAGAQCTDSLKQELIHWVSTEIGPLAKPEDVRFVSGLPKTSSGKIMRRLLREFVSKGFVRGDTTTLEDLSVLRQFMKNPEEGL
jgi:acetyl-CoA synthetase